jgi:glycosyltransferase involved in cell wall biosynthesis
VLDGVLRADPSIEVLVVDDASTDATRRIVDDVAARTNRVDVLARPAKLGLGSAYRDGFAWALTRGASICVQMDGDGSHDPATLPALLAAVRHGADLAIGSRYVPGGSIVNWPYKRRFLSRWGNRYVAATLGLAVNDATSGYRAWSADALGSIEPGSMTSQGYAFQVELTHRIVRRGGRVVEFPTTFTDRIEGQSKMSWRIVREGYVLVTGWALRDAFTGRRWRRAEGAAK